MHVVASVVVAGWLAACGSTAYHQVKVVNATDRPIEEVFIYPMGAVQHGASRGSLAPGANLEVKVPAGNVDVLAVSAKVRIDDTTQERRRASGTLELKRPMELVFYDSSQPPPPEQLGVVAVPFRVEEPVPTP